MIFFNYTKYKGLCHFDDFWCYYKSNELSYDVEIVFKFSFLIANHIYEFQVIHSSYFITNQNSTESISTFYKDYHILICSQLKVPV